MTGDEPTAPTPPRSGEPGPSPPAWLLPAADEPAAGIVHRYVYLDAEDEPVRRNRFPVLPFVFMLTMALAVVGLGLRVVASEIGGLTARETGGSEGRDGGSVASTGGSGGGVPFCVGVTRRQQGQIDRALVLVERTREGQRLVDQLAEHDVCIGVEDLAYNSGYAHADRSWTGSWDDSYIVVDADLLSVAEPDVVAALLVHEATHIDRFVRGKSCGVFDDCEVLDNGVVVEEEVAAHAAEAQWWITIYGPSGRLVNSGYGYSLDALAAAYLKGEAAFRQFVIEIRSDPREGTGI